MTRRPLALLAATALAAGLAACGSKSDNVNGTPTPRNLSLLLDYLPNADHAGIYAAEAQGDFKRAGLNVDISTPGDAATPLKLLAGGKVDLAISYEPELLLARDQGSRLVAVAAVAQVPLTSLISLPAAKVDSVKDLVDKKVGTAGIPYQAAYLKSLAQDAAVDPDSIKEVNVGFDLVRAMVSKRVDATLGAYWNVEGVQLAADRKRPRIVRMEQAGVPTYDELVLVAREDWLRDNGALVRRFIQALQTATRAVVANPTVGVNALKGKAEGVDDKVLAAQVTATAPVLVPADASKPFGWMEPKEWEAFSRWMLANKLVSQLPTDAALTNEFLPGQGVVAADDDARRGETNAVGSDG